jgi:hypothetical protein
MNRVVLFHLKDENISITIEAYFDEVGALVVEGYDIGKTVEEYWGDSDYEYSIKVSPEELKKLYVLLKLEPHSGEALLTYLQENYKTNTCYSDLRTFLDRNGIRHEGFSWI